MKDLSDTLFCNNKHTCFVSGVGKNIRHILDYYWCFLDGYKEKVDYDQRQRDERTESERQFAIDKIMQTIEALENIATAEDAGKEVAWVKNDMCRQTGHLAYFSPSTVQREMLFLMSHTIHHFAMIAMILRVQGYHPSKDFGMVPSTLLYAQSQKQ